MYDSRGKCMIFVSNLLTCTQNEDWYLFSLTLMLHSSQRSNPSSPYWGSRPSLTNSNVNGTTLYLPLKSYPYAQNLVVPISWWKDRIGPLLTFGEFFQDEYWISEWVIPCPRDRVVTTFLHRSVRLFYNRRVSNSFYKSCRVSRL